ncbi:MAG TPA: hypothetical protein DCL15_15645 [Chloroflexi bacterium]|nr:hypothetical protein [Chloroflexota bacterium]
MTPDQGRVVYYQLAIATISRSATTNVTRLQAINRVLRARHTKQMRHAAALILLYNEANTPGQ